MSDTDPEEALYAAAPDGFVAARDALAKQLRDAGDRAGARRIKALRRPTRAAWAINVAVRQRPEAARKLTDAAASLGAAQRELLSGGASDSLRAAQARVTAADEALIEALPVDDPPTLEKVRQTLRAAAIDADVLAEVTSGRLLHERLVSGFGDLAGFPSPPSSQTGGDDDADGARSAEAAALAAEEERAANEAEQRAADRRARLARARDEEAAADAAVLSARAALDADEAAVRAAQAALQEAEATVARRRVELDAAEARLAVAVREREQADAG